MGLPGRRRERRELEDTWGYLGGGRELEDTWGYLGGGS